MQIVFWSDFVLFQKKYQEDGKRKASVSLYSQLPDTPEIQHALEVSQLQSDVRKHTGPQSGPGPAGPRAGPGPTGPWSGPGPTGPRSGPGPVPVQI